MSFVGYRYSPTGEFRLTDVHGELVEKLLAQSEHTSVTMIPGLQEKAMLSDETRDAYRRMTPGERLTLTLQASREGMPYLFLGTPEMIDRRFELMRREKNARNLRIREGLAILEDANEGD